MIYVWADPGDRGAYASTTSEVFMRIKDLWHENIPLLVDFAVVAARHAWFPNFRGTWLSDNTFLNADVLAYFFSNDNVKLVACEVSPIIL